MTCRIAFAGLRHGHITGLYKRVAASPDFQIAAVFEDDPAGLANAKAWQINVTHNSFEAMLADTSFDVLAIGDYYGIRGERVIRALETGHHVMIDKPLCTTFRDLDRIRALASGKKLCIGEMLDLRTNKCLLAVRQAAKEGGILGKIDSVSFTGRHNLDRANRPAWYFEPGNHGGTLNDIAIHALDGIEYITGSPIVSLDGARTWNARVPDKPWFKDGGMCLFSLKDGCGVMGDVSYFGPDPFYWRFEFCGRNGIASFCYSDSQVTFRAKDAKENTILPDAPAEPDYLDVFMSELKGNHEPFGTAHILDISEKALRLQAMADSKL